MYKRKVKFFDIFNKKFIDIFLRMYKRKVKFIDIFNKKFIDLYIREK